MLRMTQVQRSRANWWVDKSSLAILAFIATTTLVKVDGLQVSVARIEGVREAQVVIDAAQNDRIRWLYDNK